MRYIGVGCGDTSSREAVWRTMFLVQAVRGRRGGRCWGRGGGRRNKRRGPWAGRREIYIHPLPHAQFADKGTLKKLILQQMINPTKKL